MQLHVQHLKYLKRDPTNDSRPITKLRIYRLVSKIQYVQCLVNIAVYDQMHVYVCQYVDFVYVLFLTECRCKLHVTYTLYCK